MRRRPFGLRTRVLLALIATSAITLLAAAAALLSPLQDRLKEQAAASLATTARQARPEFAAALRERRFTEAETRVNELAAQLNRRTDARVLVYNASTTGLPPLDATVGTPLLDTDFAFSPGTSPEVYEAIATGRDVETAGDEEARVALPFYGGRYYLVLRKPLSDVDETVGEVRRAFLAAAGIGLAVSLVLGLLLSSTLLRRLERLRRGALRMTTDGMDAPPVVDDGRDEVGDLARALGRMQEGLRRQEAARRRFVSTASHELRTPLTSLSGTLELLGEDLEAGDVDAADAREQVARAELEVGRLRNLATELLDLSRLDAGIELRSEPVELAELCRAVAAEFEHRAQLGGHAITVLPTKGPVWGSGDPDAVARVVRILLDNALKYGGERARVTLAPMYHGERAQVAVTDGGPGVPAAERDRIFERFARGARTREGGFGLGLAIGRELAERLGGSLTLDEGHENGARFVLELAIELPAGGGDAAP